MATVKTILAPLDLNGHTESVLDFARTLADALGASLHLLHVISCPMADADAQATRCLEATTHLRGLLVPADHAQRHVVTACIFGTPAPEIARYATEHRVDLIVMGTHAHGPTFQMLTGSIAETVTGAVPCAVLTVKAPCRAPGLYAAASLAEVTRTP